MNCLRKVLALDKSSYIGYFVVEKADMWLPGGASFEFPGHPRDFCRDCCLLLGKVCAEVLVNHLED